VEALPVLVLVDTKGIVQSVHVGSRPDITERLKEELDGLLAGKDLAAEYLKAHKAQAAETTEGEPQGTPAEGNGPAPGNGAT